MNITSTDFFDSDRYSLILSIVLKIGRFFVLRICYENSTIEYFKIDIDNLNDSDDLITSNTNFNNKSLKRFKIIIDRFIIRDSHIFIDWLLDLRVYDMDITRNTITINQIDWNNDQISYDKQISFSISDFRGFIHGFIIFIRSMLFEDFLFDYLSKSTSEILSILWSIIFDNSLNSISFFNFLNEIDDYLIVLWTIVRWLNVFGYLTVDGKSKHSINTLRIFINISKKFWYFSILSIMNYFVYLNCWIFGCLISLIPVSETCFMRTVFYISLFFIIKNMRSTDLSKSFIDIYHVKLINYWFIINDLYSYFRVESLWVCLKNRYSNIFFKNLLIKSIDLRFSISINLGLYFIEKSY